VGFGGGGGGGVCFWGVGGPGIGVEVGGVSISPCKEGFGLGKKREGYLDVILEKKEKCETSKVLR